MLGLERVSETLWGRRRPGTIVDVRRVLLVLTAAGVAALLLGVLAGLAVGPLRPFLALVAAFLGRHFGIGR